MASKKLTQDEWREQGYGVKKTAKTTLFNRNGVPLFKQNQVLYLGIQKLRLKNRINTGLVREKLDKWEEEDAEI